MQDAMAPSCAACQKLKKGLCKVCMEKATAEVQTGGGDAKTRSKSPLANSAERPGKVMRVDIATLVPLAACPEFPKLGGAGTGSGGSGDEKPNIRMTTSWKIIRRFT